MPQCTATAKSTGRQCTRDAMLGRTKCYVHGGPTPRGADSPHFKDGKRSLYYLPTKLKAIAEQIPADFDKGLLARNTLLTEAFIRQKLELLEDAPDAASIWGTLRKELDNLITAYSDEAYGKVAISLDKLNRIVDERQLYHQAVAEIRNDLAEQRANQKAIAEIEFKGQNAIPVGQLVKFLLTITELAAAVISNKKELYALYDGIDSIIGAQSRATVMIESSDDASD